MRGYFGIGIYHPKKSVNVGTLWRSAYIAGAQFIFTVGARYGRQASDTVAADRHIPLFEYQDYGDFINATPRHCQVVCIEMGPRVQKLTEFNHPERAIYLLGAEDSGIPQWIMSNHKVVQIPTEKDWLCLNVSVAGSIVMYDRMVKNE